MKNGEKPFQSILDKLRAVKEQQQEISKIDDVVKGKNYDIVRIPKDKDVDLEVRNGKVYMK